jgi:hypothetical protein
MELLKSNPTAQHLDDLVTSFAILGNLAADAQSLAEEAEMKRKYAQAEAFKRAKEMRSDKPLSDAAANNYAMLETQDEQQEEINARTKAKKITHLLDAVEQNINAIKFLGKFDSAPSANINLPRAR